LLRAADGPVPERQLRNRDLAERFWATRHDDSGVGAGVTIDPAALERLARGERVRLAAHARPRRRLAC
jgi:hypothetical protein